MAKKKSTVPGGGVKVDKRPIVAVVLAIALSAATWFLFTSPAREKAATAAAARTSAEQSLAGHQGTLAKLQGGGATQASRLLVKARELDSALPGAPDKVRLVADVDTLARSQGVQLTQLNPTGDVAGPGGATASQFDASVTGSRTAVTAFVAQLTARTPMVTISKLKLDTADAAGTGPSATATFTMYAWSVSAPVLPGAGG